MFKLLFSTAMIAPVLVFALKGVTSNESVFETAEAASYTSEQMMQTCRSQTLPVVFHDTVIESHSAAELREALDGTAACETSFVRLTSLIPEDSEDALESAKARRMELAATIAAIVGEDVALTLPVHTDTRTAAVESPILHHALVRIERRPASLGGDAPASVAIAARSTASNSTMSTLN